MLDDDEDEGEDGLGVDPWHQVQSVEFEISHIPGLSPQNSQRMSTPMEVDPPAATAAATAKASTSNKDKPRFEVKKVEHLELIPGEANFIVECRRFMGMGYSYSKCVQGLTCADIVVDNCAICRNHIMDLCIFLVSHLV